MYSETTVPALKMRTPKKSHRFYSEKTWKDWLNAFRNNFNKLTGGDELNFFTSVSDLLDWPV
jgi:hypothetical protein